MRWFWWRINAWCEIVAMVSSFVVSVALLVLARNGVIFSTHVALIVTVAITTVCWMVAAFAGPQTDRAVLLAFYTKVRPFGPGWTPIQREAGILAQAPTENIPMALLGWVAGCTAIWSALFTVGSVLYGRYTPALLTLLVFSVSCAVLVRVTRELWMTTAEA